MLRSANYFIGEAVTSLLRNKVMSFSSIATVASCIFLLVSSMCLVLNISYIARQMQNFTGISVFFDKDLPQDGIDLLGERIMAVEGVERITFVSPEDALLDFNSKFNDKAARLENDNPFLNEFEVELSDIRRMDEIIQELLLLKPYGVDNVRGLTDVAKAMITISNIINVISVVIIAILGILSVVIVMNTIKLTVNSRRNEISIMKYVGATDAFIKWPFLIEGLLIGLIGAAVPAIICGFGYNSVINMAYRGSGFMEYLIVLRRSSEILPFLIPGAVIIGAAIGTAGSVISLRRYLDV
jgi:cell division transport system permease protein